MKTTLLVLCLLATVFTSHAQDVGTKYSGRSTVAGLGAVDFPPGEWFLEFRHEPPEPNPAHRPDYFGFRKVGDTPERLGFRRYTPATANPQLVRYLDGLNDGLTEGVPNEALPATAVGGMSYPMRFNPPLSAIDPATKEIAYSFINVKPGRPLNWLCHAYLYRRDGWVYVIFHASPSVTNPDTVQEIEWVSRPAK
jgi:hypothetical protein